MMDGLCPAIFCWVATGIRPALELAQEIGLDVNRGVLVDNMMRTSDPHILAAGDVAEFDQKVVGLWPVAISQAEVAAANAVAENGAIASTYVETPPVTMLKVVGIDITSIGRVTSRPEDTVIALEESAEHRYRKLIIAGNKIEGAILLGYPMEAPGVAEAVKRGADISASLDVLQAGDWEALAPSD